MQEHAAPEVTTRRRLRRNSRAIETQASSASTEAMVPVSLSFFADSDLHGAVARLGAVVEVYEDLFPQLRVNARNLISVAAELVSEGMRPEAGLMFSSLRDVARIMGARALERTADQAIAQMGRIPSEDDYSALVQASIALVQDCCGLNIALRAARFGGQTHSTLTRHAPGLPSSSSRDIHKKPRRNASMQSGGKKAASSRTLGIPFQSEADRRQLGPSGK